VIVYFPNFAPIERLAQREERDWTYFGRLRHEREKKLRDPQDVLIEADRLRQQRNKRRPRSDILDSLFSRKVRLFGHFEGWSVDTLTAAVSKLQTSASAGELSKRDHPVNTRAILGETCVVHAQLEQKFKMRAK
jgi:hypothetical protein